MFNGIWEAPYGLQVSGVYFYGSGLRFSTSVGGDPRGQAAGGENRYRTTATAIGPAGTIAPRNNLVGSPIQRLDMRLQKHVQLARVGVDGMLELFNVFDHANYGLVHHAGEQRIVRAACVQQQRLLRSAGAAARIQDSVLTREERDEESHAHDRDAVSTRPGPDERARRGTVRRDSEDISAEPRRGDQARSSLKNPPPTTAPTVKDTLYRIGDALGMLRDTDERDTILTMDWRSTGTMTVDGQTCTLANYRGQVRYNMPAMRVDFACAQPDGKPGTRHVEVIANAVAWNETDAWRRRHTDAECGQRSARATLVAAVLGLQGRDARRRTTPR